MAESQHDAGSNIEREAAEEGRTTFYRSVIVRSLIWRRSVRRIPGDESEQRYPPTSQFTHAL